MKGLGRSIAISNGTDTVVIFHEGTTLPASLECPVQLPVGSLSASFQIVLTPASVTDPVTPLGEMSFTLPEESKEELVSLNFQLEESGLTVQVLKGSSTKETINTLEIPMSV